MLLSDVILISIPAVGNTFSIIYQSSGYTAVTLEGGFERIGNSAGYTFQHQGIIYKEGVIDWLQPIHNSKTRGRPCSPISSFLLSVSAKRMYRKGERGHPCLNPLIAWK